MKPPTMERRYNTLSQRSPPYVGKRLSFFKSGAYHQVVTKWFITQYHLSISLTN